MEWLEITVDCSPEHAEAVADVLARYAPGGAALIVSCVTDNKNRTTPEIRSIIEKRGGKMANSGSVAWMFKRKGEITVKTSDVPEDKLMEIVLEAGAA